MMNKPISGFFKEYRFLSNFWSAEVQYEGQGYPSVEHAFQAAKTLDPVCRITIQETESPGEAKKLGQKVPIRDDWEDIKLGVMEDLVRQKFTKHPELQRKLIETGKRELIEDNWWGDVFYGVCNGVGENNLGKILIKVREELVKERMQH